MFPGEWHRHTARVYTVYSIHAKWIMYNCIIIMYIYMHIYKYIRRQNSKF
jgi:hypothetical protein